jgi:hypothetical protein
MIRCLSRERLLEYLYILLAFFIGDELFVAHETTHRKPGYRG